MPENKSRAVWDAADCARYSLPATKWLLSRTLSATATQSYSLCLAFSTALGVFLLPFMGKFIQLIKSATNFLHALGQSISHGRWDCRLVMAVEKTLLFQVS